MYLYALTDWNKTMISPSYARSSEPTVHGNVFRWSNSKSWCSSYIVAHWIGNGGKLSNHAELGLKRRPGIKKKYQACFG